MNPSTRPRSLASVVSATIGVTMTESDHAAAIPSTPNRKTASSRS